MKTKANIAIFTIVVFIISFVAGFLAQALIDKKETNVVEPKLTLETYTDIYFNQGEDIALSKIKGNSKKEMEKLWGKHSSNLEDLNSEVWSLDDNVDIALYYNDKNLVEETRIFVKATFKAKILEINDKTLLVEPFEDTNERKSADKISVPKKNLVGQEPHIDDVVEISYDGHLMETYPAQIGKVYQIYVVNMLQY